MGKRLHVVSKQRDFGNTEAFNWCFDKFRDLMGDLGCNICSEDEFSDFWEMTKDDYKRAIAILKLMKDVPLGKCDYSKQREMIDHIENSDEFKKLFVEDEESYCTVSAEDVNLNDVVVSLNDLDIDLDELLGIMESFLKEADKKSDWIQFEAW